MLFVNYQCKKKKSVNLLSSMHNAPSIDDSNKEKPSVIHFYNRNKVGVDVVDQMLRQYSTHTASRRWPLAVWTNILDIAALNSWVIYKQVTEDKISRRDFILALVETLRNKYVGGRVSQVQQPDHIVNDLPVLSVGNVP